MEKMTKKTKQSSKKSVASSSTSAETYDHYNKNMTVVPIVEYTVPFPAQCEHC